MAKNKSLKAVNQLELLKKPILFLVIIAMPVLAVTSVPCAQGNSGTVAESASVLGDQTKTRFVVDLSKRVSYRTFVLPDPYRLIIDLPDVDFRMSQNTGNKSQGLVKAFRFGLFAPGKARIVIDVRRPFKITRSFFVKPANGQPARLVIDLSPTDRNSFLKQHREQKRKLALELRNSAPSKVSLPKLAFKPRKANRRKRKPLVVIDPGHGGIDSGAIGVNGVKEKLVVLEFSKLLRKELYRSRRYRIALTREKDVFISLRDRVAMARRAEAKLFISVHADSAPRKYRRARGATFYTLSEKASDLEARELAKQENRSDIIAGLELPPKFDQVSNILIDLAQRETQNHSIAFSNILVRNLKNKIRLKPEPVKFANFRVLKAPDIPSVLIELGYLTSSQDEKLIRSPKWQKKVAIHVARAVDNYFAQSVSGVPF